MAFRICEVLVLMAKIQIIVRGNTLQMFVFQISKDFLLANLTFANHVDPFRMGLTFTNQLKYILFSQKIAKIVKVSPRII